MSDSRLILVRHGTTKYNRKGQKGISAERIRGWIDVPLDAEGREQAKLTAERLKDYPIERIYSSPLVRARETSERIALDSDLPVPTLDRGLMPWNVGDFAGQPVEDVLPKMKILVTHDEQAPPRGETFATFRDRCLRTLARLLAEAKKDQAMVCAVTHTRNLQLAKAWLAAGAGASLDIDPKVMNDYSTEVGTGGVLVLGAT